MFGFFGVIWSKLGRNEPYNYAQNVCTPLNINTVVKNFQTSKKVKINKQKKL